AGWWSNPELDPLDGAQTSASLHDRLEELGWHLADDAEGGHALMMMSDVQAAMRSSLGLMTAQRYDPQEKTLQQQTRASSEVVLKQLAENVVAFEPGRSVFVDQVSSVVAAKPKWPRMTLLHGVVPGVPVRASGKVDPRRDPRRMHGAHSSACSSHSQVSSCRTSAPTTGPSTSTSTSTQPRSRGCPAARRESTVCCPARIPDHCPPAGRRAVPQRSSRRRRRRARV